MRADGTGVRNLTNHPANDWGPDWSSDGEWIVFNSDRDGGSLRGYLVRPDGSDLTRLPIDGWVEYATFSPDGSRIAFMSHVGSNYDIFVADVATGATTRLTDADGSDGWPSWSPDGATIAFATNATTACGRPTTRTAGTTTSPASTTTSGSWTPTAETNAVSPRSPDSS